MTRVSSATERAATGRAAAADRTFGFLVHDVSRWSSGALSGRRVRPACRSPGARRRSCSISPATKG